MSRIAFSWNGLPFYAAGLLREAIFQIGEPCDVIGTPPSVPVKGMEDALGNKIHWIPVDQRSNWASVGLDVPEIFVESGWRYSAFQSLRAEVRARGGTVIGMSDANWRGDFRQRIIGKLAFALHYRRQFDAMIVPGKEGRRLMNWFGFDDDHIYEGMYGSNPLIFNEGDRLALRPKQFLFVGQFVERKDVLGLARAFVRFVKTRPDWTLRLCGSGAQKQDIPRHPNIIVENFVQANELADRYRAARFFVLPSLIEAWGLVVHEAAMSGCGLILSDKIGSAADLSNSNNAFRFVAGDENAILSALHKAANCDEEQLLTMESESRRLGALFGPRRFGSAVHTLIRKIDAVKSVQPSLTRS